MRALFRFRSLCSQIPDPRLREFLEIWAVEHLQEFRVEARVDIQGGTGALNHYRDATLQEMIRGLVASANEVEHAEWLEGDHKLGTIITRSIHILRDKP